MEVLITLSDWQWDMVDAEAGAMGMTRQELLLEMIQDEIALEEVDDMRVLS